MDTPDRIGRIALIWFSLTTVIFWLPAVRGPFDGSSYEWGLFGLGGRGVSGDYWFPLLMAVISLAVIAGGWRSRTWAFVVIALWNVLILLAAIALAISNPDDFRFRGDTLGVDVSLAWIGPVLFGAGSVVSLMAAWPVYKSPTIVSVAWNRRNWWWLAGLAALLPIQFILLRFGDAKSLADQVGVIITMIQWFFADRVFRSCPMLLATSGAAARRS